MAEYNVLNGDLLQLDETTVGVIDFINVVDGTCEISNTSDNGVVFEFISGGHVSVEAFGKLDIQGKMISIGATDGTRGASVNHWQSNHPVNVIWVETSPGSTTYMPWTAVNSPLSTPVPFSNFADDYSTGRVFSWNNGVIEFSTNVDEASVPIGGANIMVPNIIMSTENPFMSIHLSEFTVKEGGDVSISNTGFSDFGGVFDGISSLTMSNSSFFGPMYISSCDTLSTDDVHVTPRGNSGIGLSISYCNNAIINNTTGISLYSTGIDLSYLKSPSVSNIRGITYLSDSPSDHAVLFDGIRDGEISIVAALGGPLKTNNCTECKVVDLLLIDRLNLQEENIYSKYNILSRGCSNISFISVFIPAGGSAKRANIELYDNASLDIVNTDIQTSFADVIATGTGNFQTRVSQMFFAGSASDKPIDFNETNDGLLLHGITSLSTIIFDIAAKDTLFKGVLASLISTGDTPLTFAQIYSSTTAGKLLFTMSKDVYGTTYSNATAGVKWGADNKIYFNDIGDSVEIEVPYNLKGISLVDTIPTLIGGNSGSILVEYAINHGSGYLPYQEYTAENILLDTIDETIGFMVKLKVTATDVSVSTHINSIELQTLDSKFSYPLDYETGKIQLDMDAAMDFNAKYFIYYADGYGTASGVLVRDADGTPITGHVPPNAVVDFTYDYIGDTSNGRIAGMPFQIVIILAGSGIVANQVINETFESGVPNIFQIRTKKEYAYV